MIISFTLSVVKNSVSQHYCELLDPANGLKSSSEIEGEMKDRCNMNEHTGRIPNDTVRQQYSLNKKTKERIEKGMKKMKEKEKRGEKR